MKVAQRMIEVVSTNIANATTEGYHRQEADVRPIVLNSYGNVGIGGAEVTRVRRSVNSLLELEITRQQGNLSQASEELNVLRTIEAAFGEVGSDGLAVAIDRFFSSLTELAADPDNEAMRVQVAWAGDAVAGEFRNLGRFLTDVEMQVQRQAEGSVSDFNNLCVEIDDLTDEMASMSLRGGSNNILTDRRDQAIRELAELANIQVDGVMSDSVESLRISAWGTPVVTRAAVMELEVIVTDNGDLGVGAKDSGSWQTDARGGKIGALFSMKNDVLSSLRSDLDALANQVISAINDVHIGSIGAAGSFSELTGVTVSDEALGEWDPPVIAGSFYVRMTDTATGAVTRSKIDVDVTDTLADVDTLLDGVNGLSASVVNSSLKITADAGYTFDFLPEVLPEPYTTAITGDAVPTPDGIYTGQTNQIYACKVVGTGKVGVADDLSMEVRDGDGQLMTTLNVGQGYAAGDALDIGSGMTVAFSAGQLNNDDAFTIQALADTDTSGFLNAAGINTFFTGTSASNMSVRTDIMDAPGKRFACSRGAAMTDSAGVERMIEVEGNSYASLGGRSIQDYFRGIVIGVGQAVVVREARTAGLDNVMTQLEAQRDEISGVDLNEETAKLISLERMFQGMARVISAQDKALGELMDLL